ncbi:hypothetical protein ACTHGU_14985 [Chitinophagaceae bacterium MMS25-I14]
MRRILSYILLCVLFAGSAYVYARGRQKETMSEVTMVNALVSCMQTKDAYAYMKLFPETDSMATWIMQYASPGSREYEYMHYLLENPVAIMQKDSLIDAEAKHDFDSLIQRGENIYDIHWNAVVQVRYELIKNHQTRDVLYEKLAPVRFLGYIFIRDMLTRKTYGVSVANILQIRGQWYGGQLKGLYEASTVDEFLAQQRKKNQPDTAALAHTTESSDADRPDVPQKQRVILDRKLYAGMFDNEIPVQLYIHYLKGNCPEVFCEWEAFYKFGDQDDYIKLNVSKSSEGKWVFTEDPAQGSMELTLDSLKKKYKGTWLSSDNQTGYEVKLTEIPATPKKIKQMDEVFVKELWAK